MPKVRIPTSAANEVDRITSIKAHLFSDDLKIVTNSKWVIDTGCSEGDEDGEIHPSNVRAGHNE